MKIKHLIVLAVVLSGISPAQLQAQDNQRSLAIVIDKQTYQNCAQSVEKYKNALLAEGLSAFVIIDRWEAPDSLRAILHTHYKKNHLEGAVFIGDIPIPMIRDAQHLTTAFKMDQTRDWQLSSVPSDRFYDDFNLKFDFIKQDSIQKLYHYYSLRADSPQSIACSIYSGRIRAPQIPGKDKYTLITQYLEKVVKEKEHKRYMSQLTYFAGQGYNSNCMIARIDEKLALTEQFPFTKNGGKSINYIDFNFDENVKYRLMAELSREDLDLAILHHHGAEDTQLMNATPKGNEPKRWIELSKKFFRSKIRSARDTTQTKNYYLANYDIPADWVEGAFNAEMMLKDSLEDAGLNWYIPDSYDFVSGCRMTLLDACFNGSFHLDDYIAAYHIFNPGNTIVVKANTVNTLQDTWTNELLGLLNLGVTAGNWAKGNMTLESHLIGDPTFSFKNADPKKRDFNLALRKEEHNARYWKSLMKEQNSEIRSLALKMLDRNNAITSDELYDIQAKDEMTTVRLMAFSLLVKRADEKLPQAIRLALSDNYELIRRLGAFYASKNLDPLYADELFAYAMEPGLSSRVSFQLNMAMNAFPSKIALEAVQKTIEKVTNPVWAENKKPLKSRIENNAKSEAASMQTLMDYSKTFRENRFTISGLRNLVLIEYLTDYFTFFKESPNDELRLMLAEAFGWYRYSSKKKEIIAFCTEQIKTEKNSRIQYELEKTLNRLK
jgi:hypothetical protein